MTRQGPSLAETAPHLIHELRALGDEYGPLGVIRTAAQMWPDAQAAADQSAQQGDPQAAPAVTEWGVRWGSVFVAFDTETAARAYVLSRPHGERVLVSRTRVTFPDLVTDWTEVTVPNTTERTPASGLTEEEQAWREGGVLPAVGVESAERARQVLPDRLLKALDRLDAERTRVEHWRGMHEDATGQLRLAIRNLSEARAKCAGLSDLAGDHKVRAEKAERLVARLAEYEKAHVCTVDCRPNAHVAFLGRAALDRAEARGAEVERERDAEQDERLALRAAVALAADREHARGCHYRHQQGETDECNSCTAYRIEKAASNPRAALAERDAEKWREGNQTVPGYWNPYERQGGDGE